MRAFYLIIIISVVITSSICANTLSMDVNFHINLNCYYRMSADIHTLTAEAFTTESLYAYDQEPPYNGGSGFDYLIDGSESYWQLASIFEPRAYMNPDPYVRDPIPVENWTTNYILGTLIINPTLSFPTGSPVSIELFYAGRRNDASVVPDYFSKELGIYTDSYTNTIYEISGDQEVNTVIDAIVGQQYDIFVSYEAGLSNHPITGRLVSGVLFSFTAIPEPTTLLLFSLGVMALRKRNI